MYEDCISIEGVGRVEAALNVQKRRFVGLEGAMALRFALRSENSVRAAV